MCGERLNASKQQLREELLAARLRLESSERSSRSRAASARLLALDAFSAAPTIALYAAIGAEADPGFAARAAAAAGQRIAWPRLTAGTRVLSFAACPSADLVCGDRGTRHPPLDAVPVPLDQIDCIVVPGVAFDGAGRRLGRGGGYYDATLSALPARTIRLGFGFDLQVVAEVPGEPHDVAVHAVVTEARVLWASRPSR